MPSVDALPVKVPFPRHVHRRSPLKKGADSKNSLKMEKQRFKTPAIRDFIYGVTKEF